MIFLPTELKIITTTDNSLELFHEQLGMYADDQEAKDSYIWGLINMLWPQNVTEEIARFCIREHEEYGEDWVSVYGDIDIEKYKLIHGIDSEDFDENKIEVDLNAYWQDRKDREIREILEEILQMGYTIPYWPYIRDEEYQEMIPHTIKDQAKEQAKKKEESATLNNTERAMILILLQRHKLFPKQGQYTDRKPVSEFIAEILQVSYETYDSGRKKAENYLDHKVTESQKPTLKKYLLNIKRIFKLIEHKEILSEIDNHLSKLE